MPIKRTRTVARVLRGLRGLADLSNSLRLFLALWDHWRSHAMI